MKKATCAFLSAVTLAMFGAVAQENQSVNLVQNGDFSTAEDAKDMKRWRDGYCFMHDASIPANSPMRQDMKKAVKWEIKDGMAVIAKSPDLVKYCKDDRKVASRVSGGYSKFIQLAQTNGGNYVVSLQYQMKNPAVTDAKGYILISTYEKPENKSLFNILPKGKLLVFPLAVTGDEWKTFRKEFAVPAGINWLGMVVRIDGVGDLKFKDVSLTEKK